MIVSVCEYSEFLFLKSVKIRKLCFNLSYTSYQTIAMFIIQTLSLLESNFQKQNAVYCYFYKFNFIFPLEN